MGDWAGLGILLFGAGGTLWALRMVLRNKLITSASHAEHMQQWADQVKGLLKRITDQEESHRQEILRTAELTATRIAELRSFYEDRVKDRDARLADLARQLDRIWTSYKLTDEAYTQLSGARINQFGSALRTVEHILRESPLADHLELDRAPTVGNDDDGAGSEDESVDRH